MSIEIAVIGVMTGTSGDGADMTLCQYRLSAKYGISGGELQADQSVSFPVPLRRRIHQAQKGTITIKDYLVLQRDYSHWIAMQIASAMSRWKITAKNKNILCGVHGQTLWHQPPPVKGSTKGSAMDLGYTMQMIDGPLVAALTGLTVVTSFRQSDMALGGQGAPLSPMYHEYLVRSGAIYAKPPVVIQNLGGIGNVTYIGQAANDVCTFDTGPANVLIDLAVEEYTRGKKKFDRAGLLARQGAIHWPVVNRMSKESYFRSKPPKSTGRELFNVEYLRRFSLKGLDLIATVTAFTAKTICDAYAWHLPKGGKNIDRVYLAGGGARNAFLVELIEELLNTNISKRIQVISMDQTQSTNRLNVRSNHVEPAAFGYLALRALLGQSMSQPKLTGAKARSAAAAIHGGENFRHLLKIIKPLF
jgi:anhydro-N-acetylmuramic acid kinase